MLATGLIAGILLGGAAGFFLFHSNPATLTAPLSTPSAAVSPSPTPQATPTPSATPTSTTAPVAQGVVRCPVATPAGQHPLGTPGPPGSGQHAVASLDVCGGGSATIPSGTARFTTAADWGLGIADSCPQGSSGEAGVNVVLTVSEVLPGGGQGPDTATENGDWTDGGSTLMATGGNYQLQVTTVSPDCVWHIAIYPT